MFHKTIGIWSTCVSFMREGDVTRLSVHSEMQAYCLDLVLLRSSWRWSMLHLAPKIYHGGVFGISYLYYEYNLEKSSAYQQFSAGYLRSYACCLPTISLGILMALPIVVLIRFSIQEQNLFSTVLIILMATVLAPFCNQIGRASCRERVSDQV